MRRHVSCLWALYPHPRQPHPLGAAAHRACGASARAAVLDLLLINALGGGTFEEIVARAVDQFAGSWPVAMLAAGVWFLISWFFHQRLISYATGARGISRREAPRLYNVLENLCISRGIPMPALQIIETPALMPTRPG